MSSTLVTRHHGHLGTVIELRIEADSDDAALEMDGVAVSEIARLETMFNIFDEASAINRWRRGEEEPLAEIEQVLAIADRWFRWSGGAFDHHAGRLSETWAAAAEADRLPTAAELERARARTGVTSVDLNGIAKGWIVDRAVDLAMALPGSSQITINGGGDIRHTGPARLKVGIENPTRPYDNAAPLAVAAIKRGAIATSGRARKGWSIAGKHYSDVLDPRTGMPTETVAQVSVVAESACTADAATTALTVLGEEERAGFVDGLDEPIAFLIVGADGSVARNDHWRAVEIS